MMLLLIVSGNCCVEEVLHSLANIELAFRRAFCSLDTIYFVESHQNPPKIKFVTPQRSV